MCTFVDLVPSSLSTNILVLKDGSNGSVRCDSNNPGGFGGMLKWFDPQGNLFEAVLTADYATILFYRVTIDTAGIYQCVYSRDKENVTIFLDVIIKEG